MSQLVDAIIRFDERKHAIAGGRLPDGTFRSDTPDQFRLLISGYDLDPDEVFTIGRVASAKAAATISRSLGTPTEVLTGLWVDGLMAGLMLADLRAREAAPTVMAEASIDEHFAARAHRRALRERRARTGPQPRCSACGSFKSNQRQPCRQCGWAPGQGYPA